MPVIALTQEMGSLAKDVAIQLAEEMQLTMMRHEVVEHVASKMHVPRSLINRLREGKAGPIERLTADRDSMAVYTAEEVLEFAAQGNVILRGWGATMLLRPVPHVVCVRITRPFDKRVQWLMDHLDTDDRESRCSASPGAIRCCTTRCSTPTGCRSTAACSRSGPWPRVRSSPRPRRRARC
jgi:hypothetical protein